LGVFKVSKNATSASFVRASIAAAIGVVALIGISSPVFAAEAEAEDEEAEDVELEEVQVTGTRIQNPNVTSANPITSISGEEMRSLGFVNVGDALTMLVPQNISTYMPSVTGDDQAGSGGGGMDSLDRGSYFIGNTIANLRGMDPAFGSRTLTLVDGRRVVSTSNQADVVDMNIIPSNLLQRMDVVTGGASATYGSGAMAGVVNLVLNNRMQGVNVDLDYGVNEAGDGGSPHVSISGGRSFLDGRAHALLSVEWQDQSAIRDCAAARDWCRESRFLFNNASGSTSDVMGVLNPLPGYGDIDGDGLADFPARFEMFEHRRQQHAPTGTVRHANVLLTTGYRFTDDGTDVEEYAYGFRGGSGGQGLGGDGPLTTQGTVMRPSNERRTMFGNFEYNVSDTTTAYLQTNYAETEGLNQNSYTTGDYCVRFHSGGSGLTLGGTALPGDTIYYGGGGIGSTTVTATGEPYLSGTLGGTQRTPVHSHQGFREHVGITTAPAFNAAGNAPWWYTVGIPAAGYDGGETPPNFPFIDATGEWLRVDRLGVGHWVLEAIHMSPTAAEFVDNGAPATLPGLGRNAYPFLYGLSDEALYQVQRGAGGVVSQPGANYHSLQNPVTGAVLTGFNPGIGGNTSGVGGLWGANPCGGYTALRKVWNPQFQQWTEQESETMRVVAGIKGRFGSDWRWDTYYQYGHTNSSSTQNNIATAIRLNMSMDGVVDDRQFLADGVTVNPNYGRPVCRMVRDGLPALDYEGVPISEPDDLAALMEGCVPINVFGTTPWLTAWESPIGGVVMTPEERQLMQQQAIDYSFVDSTSRGGTSLQTLAFTTSGTLWEGLGSGPLTGAFGLEVRENKTDNKGTPGLTTIYQRADLASVWSDAFSGKSRVTEGYTEFDLPLISGVEGVNLLSINTGLRYASYYNKGGAGTTGQSATQGTFNWKFQTVFEPFDFVRLRLTRSRDLRAAGYRDLFLNQPSQPDQNTGRNPWRERTAFSAENQQERWGQVRVGNPDLRTEKSNTLTVGLVLSPGGWAQGMRLSADYFTISVKDGITTSFNAQNPILACWEESGNEDAQYFEDGEINPDFPGVNGLFNETLQACQDLTFAQNPDGSRDFGDILSFNSARPENSLPIKRRGIDVAWSYSFPLSRVFEVVPGSMSLSLRGSRALEASGIQHIAFANINTQPVGFCASRGGTLELNGVVEGVQGGNCLVPVDFVGQMRSSVFIPGVSASPKWTGNVSASYRVGDLSTSLSARYIGGARMDNTWCDADQFALGSCTSYMNADGQLLNGSIDRNWVDSYMNFALNGSYDLDIGNMRQFQVFGSINNLFDKTPPFSGGGLSGASAGYHDTYGRAYRMGVRMRF
jgi:outer membrane receptor protein involved in Fe transport